METFMKLEQLVFAEDAAAFAHYGFAQVLAPWVPGVAGQQGLITQGDGPRWDFVCFGPDAAYTAILEWQQGQCQVRSVKCFYRTALLAWAFITEDAALPRQLRLMLADGKKVQLLFTGEVTPGQLLALRNSPFFR